ncbi:MAG: hypothetical protein HZA50_03410 [Planctomycetes bacterium]|nr:hypothetical protein [Planctomycetota bacterium]
MPEMHDNARLALGTILQKPARGIPTLSCNIMEHAFIERLAGEPPGSYRSDPVNVYIGMMRNMGVCMCCQFIPENPLTMADKGYESDHQRSATTGLEEIQLDGMVIDSPEKAVEHLERFEFPRMQAAVRGFDENARVREILAGEAKIQDLLGPTILKTGYGFVHFPSLRYYQYGYQNYFMAYALFPEIMERDFALQADLHILNNKAAARAYREGNLPPLYRLDHDMADGRGTLVDLKSLDRIWFPHFARCIGPLIAAGVKLLWHCDGNLMQMVPRLLECGLSGFQGFQYEFGMDYLKICAMKTRDGRPLIIEAGVSVTTTLPHGKPDDVRREMKWLVDNGPRTGLFLGASSSLTPGAPWENVKAFTDGLAHYRTHGRE